MNKYICPKCHSITKAGPGYDHMWVHEYPICKTCFIDFIEQNVPTMSPLNKFIPLEYYGDDVKNKPNDHCEWLDKTDRLSGWYETEKHHNLQKIKFYKMSKNWCKFKMIEDGMYGVVTVDEKTFCKLEPSYFSNGSNDTTKYMCANDDQKWHLIHLGVDLEEVTCKKGTIACDYYKIEKENDNE